MEALFLSAFTLGILGSFHCIGMCGPIALALPAAGPTIGSRIYGALLYNLGRTFTYAIFGWVFGYFGKALILSGFQQWLSILTGLAVFLVLVFPSIKIPNLVPGFLLQRIKNSIGQLFRQRTYSSLLAIGALNGLLPCGLVYAAVAGAISAGSPLYGAAFMWIFGAGTLPVMLLLIVSGQQLSLQRRQWVKRAVPYLAFSLSVLFVLRGLDLGIPYLSPQFSKTDCTRHSCCSHKPSVWK
ncbi:MAG: sulfite exporter TauE/SafE family protein [Chitinophagales bacterium]